MTEIFIISLLGTISAIAIIWAVVVFMLNRELKRMDKEELDSNNMLKSRCIREGLYEVNSKIISAYTHTDALIKYREAL